MSIAAIAALIPAIGKIIETVVPNPNQAAEIKAQLATQMFAADSEFYKAAGSIITAEAQGESWMQRNWRPITMLTFVFIIANNFILAPYIQFLASLAGYTLILPTLEIPEGLWGLLQIGIGGYIASRGVEKTVQSVQEGGTPILSNKGGLTPDDLREDREALMAEMRKLR